MYQQTAFFDSHFGGIKPITIFLEKDCVSDINKLSLVEKSIKKLGFVIDFSNTSSNSVINAKNGFWREGLDEKYFFICRSSDEGSLSTLKKLKSLEADFTSEGLKFNYSGAGYLFDILGNDLTRKLIFGLIIAIFSIGLVFFILNKFDFNYFIIAIIPNFNSNNCLYRSIVYAWILLQFIKCFYFYYCFWIDH